MHWVEERWGKNFEGPMTQTGPFIGGLAPLCLGGDPEFVGGDACAGASPLSTAIAQPPGTQQALLPLHAASCNDSLTDRFAKLMNLVMVI